MIYRDQPVISHLKVPLSYPSLHDAADHCGQCHLDWFMIVLDLVGTSGTC
jgi:hypothetical protein